jgi:hypothetical protein
MKVIETTQYITKIFEVETDEQLYTVRMAQNDTHDDWYIQTEDGDEIDTDSELGKQLIETCSGFKDKDPNDIQWEQEQMEIQVLEPRRKFEQWWEQNKERILAEDQLNHDMQFKSKLTQHGDY